MDTKMLGTIFINYPFFQVYNSKMPGEILKVESLESRRPMFLIHFASHRAAAVTKRNHFTESLPAHWGKHVSLMWQPNKEVEERLKAKKVSYDL